MSDVRPHRFKSVASRERHRLAAIAAMDCPLVRAIIGRRAVESWKNPEIRAKRIEGLLKAKRRRLTEIQRLRLRGQHRSRCRLTGRFITGAA